MSSWFQRFTGKDEEEVVVPSEADRAAAAAAAAAAAGPGGGGAEIGSGSQTLFVSGDRQRDTDRIRLLVDSLRDVSQAVDAGQLLVTMVDRAVQTARAERGLLFLVEEGQPVLRVARDTKGRDLPRSAAWSHKVVEHCLAEGKATCLKVDEGGGFDPSRSMVDLNIRAIMCVPLLVQEERVGAIYVDTRASTRTFSRGDLRYFEAFADMLAIVWSNRNAVEDRVAKERMSQDLALARNIQHNLVPERPLVVAGYEMFGRVIPATETGGDYFDFFKTRDDLLAMSVGDVSGHGVGAALVMAAARAYVRAFCQRSNSPRAILRRVNRHLAQDIADDMFMSMFLCVLDPITREFHYANAGHTRPVLLHGRTQQTEDYRVTGMALAVEEETDYEERGPFLLEPGDTVVMFSDGLTELRRGEELYGRARVIESIKRHGAGNVEQILEGLFADALEWSDVKEGLADDLTIAVLRANG